MRRTFKSLLIAEMLLTAMCFGTPVLAQNSDKDSKKDDHNKKSVVEEILVTASKRGATALQDVPMSIQAFTGEDFEKRGVVKFGDYARTVSGLSFEDQGPGDKKYVLRGTQSTGAATVGVYFDDIVITGNNRQDGGGRQPDIRLVDMERIEVLKGPQGTLYGASSMSGTIRMITNKPDPSGFDAAFNGDISNTRYASGMNYDADAMLNIPLVTDQLALRLVGYYADTAGWINDILAYGQKPAETGVNQTKVKGGRAALRWQFSDNVRLDTMWLHQDTDTDGAYWYQPRYGEFIQSNYQRLPWNESLDAYNLALEWTAGHGTISASASYLDREIDYRFDGTRVLCKLFTGDVETCWARQPEPLAINYNSRLDQPQERSIFSSELRYASAWEGPFQLVAGLFYEKEKNDFHSMVHWYDEQGIALPLSDRNSLVVNRIVNGEIKQKAAFFELNYDITDRLTATVGMRAFRFDIDEVGQNLVTQNRPVDDPPVLTHSKEDDVSPKYGLSFDVNKDVMIYATYAEGFRTGGNNEPDYDTGQTFPPYTSDSLKSYEVGMKGTFLDGALQLDTAAYYMDWSNLQARVLASEATGNFLILGNVGAAEIKGLEIGYRIRPPQAESFTLGGNLTFLNAELSEGVPEGAGPYPGKKGDRIPDVPKFTGNIFAQITTPVSGSWEATTRLDFSYVGKSYRAFRPDDPVQRAQGDYSLAKFRITFDNNEKYRFAFFVNNIFNENKPVTYFVDASVRRPDQIFGLQPRTVGVSFGYKFR